MAARSPNDDRSPKDYRRAARILAMQAVCQFDALGEGFRAELIRFLSDEPLLPDDAPAVLSPDDCDLAAALARELTLRAWDHRERWDALLARVSPNWTPSRMTTVDRAILRVAASEMLAGGTPPQVAINEAIEIARAYGTRDSAAFVNGVLDAVRRSVAGESAASST